MLTARRQQVLAALISEYVAHALPVASKALVEGYPLGVSSATVRNELSALEVEGYIRQPHTSAGRIPTDFGYRNFVDGLLSVDELIEDEMASQAMHDAVRDARSFTELFNRSSALLTRLTTCLAIVVPPQTQSVSLAHIGLSTLLQQPEFSSSLVLVPLLRMIEDGSLVCYINETTRNSDIHGTDEPVVRIGHENADESLENISVVATRFGSGEESGIIAVIGPTRMDYGRALCSVRAVRHALGEL